MIKSFSLLAIFIAGINAYGECNMTRNITGNFGLNHMKCNENEDV